MALRPKTYPHRSGTSAFVSPFGPIDRTQPDLPKFSFQISTAFARKRNKITLSTLGKRPPSSATITLVQKIRYWKTRIPTLQQNSRNVSEFQKCSRIPETYQNSRNVSEFRSLPIVIHSSLLSLRTLFVREMGVYSIESKQISLIARSDGA